MQTIEIKVDDTVFHVIGRQIGPLIDLHLQRGACVKARGRVEMRLEQRACLATQVLRDVEMFAGEVGCPRRAQEDEHTGGPVPTTSDRRRENLEPAVGGLR